MLKRLIRRKRARMFYLDHVEGDGCLLFEQIRKMDLEGIVCKRKDSPYKVTEKPSRYWTKVRNSRYSQFGGAGGVVRAPLISISSNESRSTFVVFMCFPMAHRVFLCPLGIQFLF
jgi:hypothetical protein